LAKNIFGGLIYFQEGVGKRRLTSVLITEEWAQKVLKGFLRRSRVKTRV